MKTLVRSAVVAVLLAVLAGTGTTVAAQRVWVDVQIGTPGYHYRDYGRYRDYGHYRHGYRYHRRYHRLYLRHHGRAVIVVGPRAHYYHRPLRAHRSRHYWDH